MKEQLLKSASEIVVASATAANEYEAKIDQLISKMNEKMLARVDIKELVGEVNIAMMKDNHSNHARFIASILKNHNPDVLVETILWVFRAYRSRNFQTNYWAAQLNAWIEVIKAELTEESYKQVYPLYSWMQINIPMFVACSDEKLDETKSKHLPN